MLKVFISHSSEDYEISKKLANLLLRDGIEVWIDYKDLSCGDILPKNIGDGLRWCNTLLLVWSKSASLSHWIEEEWTNAHSLGKTILPCILDETEIPEMLSNRIYADFRKFENGYLTLRKALNIKIIIEEVNIYLQSIRFKF